MKKHWLTLREPAQTACGIISSSGALRLSDVTCKNCLRTKRARQTLQ